MYSSTPSTTRWRRDATSMAQKAEWRNKIGTTQNHLRSKLRMRVYSVQLYTLWITSPLNFWTWDFWFLRCPQAQLWIATHVSVGLYVPITSLRPRARYTFLVTAAVCRCLIQFYLLIELLCSWCGFIIMRTTSCFIQFNRFFAIVSKRDPFKKKKE